MARRYGLSCPSITEILDTVFRPYSGIPKAVLEPAQQKSKRLHQHIALMLRGIKVPWPLDLTPELSGVKAFFDDCIERVLLVEAYVKLPKLKTQGRLDTVVVMKGEKGSTLIDWKRLAVFSHPAEFLADLQTAFYQKACISTYKIYPRRRMAMAIDRDNPGTMPRAIPFKNDQGAYQELEWAKRFYHRIRGE